MSSRIVKSVLKLLLLHHRVSHFQVSLPVQKQPECISVRLGVVLTVFHGICLAVDCGTLRAPLNGSIQGSVSTFPNVLDFCCDNGFILEGSAVRKCQANATWSGTTTFCKGALFDFVCLETAVTIHKESRPNERFILNCDLHSTAKVTCGLQMLF